MSKATRETLFTIAYMVISLIAVNVVGYLTFRQRFFHLPRPMLAFLVVGFAASLIYSSVQMRGLGLAILMVVLLFLAQVAMAPPIRPNSLIGAAMFALPVGGALLASSYVLKGLGRFKFGRFLVMGLIVGLGYALMIILFLIRSQVPVRLGAILGQAILGAKLGAGLGIGFELIDLIGPRPKHEPDYGQPPQ